MYNWNIENFSELSYSLDTVVSQYGKIFIVDSKSEWFNDFSSRIKGHEPITNKLLKEYSISLPHNTIIIDAGAHVGDTGLILAKELLDNNRSDVIVYEIDPNKSKTDFILKVAEYNNISNIEVLTMGLSDKPGKANEIKEKHAGGWQLDKKDDGEIYLDSLDNLFYINKKIGLLHLDLEGMEEDALKGCINIIKRDRPVIMMEVNQNKNKLEQIMKDLNYHEKWYGKNENHNKLFLPVEL